MKLKEIFLNWLTESRYVQHLEKHVEELRCDLAARLAEKDTTIRQLRLKIASLEADNERMRLVLMPLGSPAGAMYAAKFQAPVPAQAAVDDWQGELNKMLQEEENGIRESGRVQEHEPRADDES